MNKMENRKYKKGLTYICAKGCGTEITVTFEGQGEISCCGKKMRRGRIIPKFKNIDEQKNK
jgi:hypothetical protein